MSDQKDLPHWRGLQTDADGNHYLGTGQQVQDPNQENYTYYLGLDQILLQTRPRDIETGIKRELHHPDEPLFRVVHQVAELWFSQMLFDMDRVIGALDQSDIKIACELLHRINSMWTKISGSVSFLKDFLPKDSFMDGFRSALNPASGAESIQFRVVEARAGFRRDHPYMEVHGRHISWFETLNHMRSSRWWTPEIAEAAGSRSILIAMRALLQRYDISDWGDALAHPALVELTRALADFERGLLQFRRAHRDTAVMNLGTRGLGTAFEGEGANLIGEHEAISASLYLRSIEKTARVFLRLDAGRALLDECEHYEA